MGHNLNGHVNVDCVSDNKRKSPGGLWKWVDRIYKSVNKSGDREYFEEQISSSNVRLSTAIQEAEDEKWQDVLQVIEMGPDIKINRSAPDLLECVKLMGKTNESLPPRSFHIRVVQHYLLVFSFQRPKVLWIGECLWMGNSMISNMSNSQHPFHSCHLHTFLRNLVAPVIMDMAKIFSPNKPTKKA